MKTEILKIEIENIDIKKIEYAAKVLQMGGVVAFPTETVYGLGANALDVKAVEKVFRAKGRPTDNPLILHITDQGSIDKLVLSIPSKAKTLMDKFWPGPLTILFEKSKLIPDIITAGLQTVGLRVPSHPIALALIQEAGIPIAAPSANTSGRPSPTAVSHVMDDLYGKVDIIIDGGCARVGVESTVLDMTIDPPMILRPGGISFEELTAVIGDVAMDKSLRNKNLEGLAPRAPGMKYTHYSPKADIIVVEGEILKVVEKIKALAKGCKADNIAVGILSTEQTSAFYNGTPTISVGDRQNPRTIASNLFKALRDFDNIGVKLILAEAISDQGIGLAIMNRLEKASGYNIIRG